MLGALLTLAHDDQVQHREVGADDAAAHCLPAALALAAPEAPEACVSCTLVITIHEHIDEVDRVFQIPSVSHLARLTPHTGLRQPRDLSQAATEGMHRRAPGFMSRNTRPLVSTPCFMGKPCLSWPPEILNT